MISAANPFALSSSFVQSNTGKRQNLREKAMKLQTRCKNDFYLSLRCLFFNRHDSDIFNFIFSHNISDRNEILETGFCIYLQGDFLIFFPITDFLFQCLYRNRFIVIKISPLSVIVSNLAKSSERNATVELAFGTFTWILPCEIKRGCNQNDSQ